MPATSDVKILSVGLRGWPYETIGHLALLRAGACAAKQCRRMIADSNAAIQEEDNGNETSIRKELAKKLEWFGGISMAGKSITSPK